MEWAETDQICAVLLERDASRVGQSLHRHLALEPLQLLIGHPRHQRVLARRRGVGARGFARIAQKPSGACHSSSPAWASSSPSGGRETFAPSGPVKAKATKSAVRACHFIVYERY